MERSSCSRRARKVLDALRGDGAPQAADHSWPRTGSKVSAGVVQGDGQGGPASAHAPLPERPGEPALQLERAVTVLSPEQRAVAPGALLGGSPRGLLVTLLEGVTGAGKTEVYFEAIAATLAARPAGAGPAARDRAHRPIHPPLRGALPRRACGMAFGDRPRPASAFGGRVAEGRGRSCSAPARLCSFPCHPGPIVVDEEHEGSFKQEEGVDYQAATWRWPGGRSGASRWSLFRDAPLETAWRIKRWSAGATATAPALPPAGAPRRRKSRGRPARHAEGAPPRGGWLPRASCGADRGSAAGEQALLFLNRRGFAPLTLCRACGLRLDARTAAPGSSTSFPPSAPLPSLRLRRAGPAPAPPAAPKARSCLRPGGGARSPRRSRPGSRGARAILSSDLRARGGRSTAPATAEHRFDLMIGTQMVAKGHHFPELTLVGVVDADIGLSGGDLRAAERHLQLLYQVAGPRRPGRDPAGC